ncbi:MAG: hypothetical protein JXA96_06705 [Sedimentisphaerales bacterium]|nr:hypothetical protein [Sedimentisphaerales bacterium]
MKKLLSDLGRVLLRQFVILLIIIGIFALGYIFRKDIQIKYHKWGEESALKSIRKCGTPSTEKDFNQIQKYSQKLQRHQNALIEIGYHEERIFETKYLGAFSPEMHKAAEEYSERYPESMYSIGERGEHKIAITCPKDMMPTWEELIEKYDVLPDDPNKG